MRSRGKHWQMKYVGIFKQTIRANIFSISTGDSHFVASPIFATFIPPFFKLQIFEIYYRKWQILPKKEDRRIFRSHARCRKFRNLRAEVKMNLLNCFQHRRFRLLCMVENRNCYFWTLHLWFHLQYCPEIKKIKKY